jgi:hypothetical protein
VRACSLFVVSCLTSVSQLFVYSVPLFNSRRVSYLSSSAVVTAEPNSSKQIDLAIVYEQGHQSDNRRTVQFFQAVLV